MKKRILFLAILLFIFLMGVAIIFLVSQNKNELPEEKKEEKKIEIIDEADKEAGITLSGFDQLAVYLSQTEIEDIMSKIKEFINESEELQQIKIITCKDSYETENYVEYYAAFDQSDLLLFGRYHKEKSDLFQWTEENIQNESFLNWEAQKNKFENTQDWKEEEKMPQMWKYEEIDPRPVTINNFEDTEVAEYFQTVEQKELFCEQILLFLQSREEYRRDLFIDPESIKVEDGKMIFNLKFSTERIDKKVLEIIYEVDTGYTSIELK